MHDELLRALTELGLERILDPDPRSGRVIELADPTAIEAEFPEGAPLELGVSQAPAAPAAAVEAAVRSILRLSMRTDHPMFFNQNYAGADPVAVVGDWLGASLNTTAATFEVAPVLTLVERAVLRRMARLAGFPIPETVSPGLMAAGGSLSNLYALQIARVKRFPEVVRHGQSAVPPLRVYTSLHAHYSLKKAVSMLGLGTESLVVVDTDERGRMRPESLRAALEGTAAEGAVPLAINATAGTTVLSAFDPLPELTALAREFGAWIHVDGCYGASALFSARHRHLLEGVERVDSLAWNLHKLGGATQQCAVLLLREPELLRPTFATGADYIFQKDKLNAELDTGDLTFHCGRRPDALKAWLMWRVRGERWFEQRIDRAVERASHLRARIQASEGRFRIAAPPSFTNTCFWWIPEELRDLDTAALISAHFDALHGLGPAVKARLQAEGSAMLGVQPVDEGPNCFRMLFINPVVEDGDVDELLGLLERHGEAAWRERTW